VQGENADGLGPLLVRLKMKNNKNRDMQAKRIMHVIFARKYHNQEQMAAILINRQINNHPVAVCVRGDCDAYHIRLLLN
tara:strand:- start:249 stop:485 length:237 start_codon:yes stop_codon:yes gene_type:complete